MKSARFYDPYLFGGSYFTVGILFHQYAVIFVIKKKHKIQLQLKTAWQVLDWRKNAENPKKIKIKPPKSGPKIMEKEVQHENKAI